MPDRRVTSAAERLRSFREQVFGLHGFGTKLARTLAPARSGKGVGLVVPTLLGWSGSAVIHDINGEKRPFYQDRLRTVFEQAWRDDRSPPEAL